jgi:hypothetical protein
MQLAGLAGWFAWSGVYLCKLPTLADRMVILLTWFTNLVAPADIVQAPQGRLQRVVPGKMPAEAKSTAQEQPRAHEDRCQCTTLVA